ncbi:MAG: hypothetical protein U0R28_12865 [Candidatus Nanopelagicales bacterium]|nr:hypothetical protein [Actinomycetota bacterium]
MSSPAVVIVKTGRFPMAYGILGAIRSAHAAGFRTYAFADSTHVPYAWSRALTAPITRAPDVPCLLALAERTGPAALIAASDGAAVLIADNLDTLRHGGYLLPGIPSDLPRVVADKARLSHVAADCGVAAPLTVAGVDLDVEDFVTSGRLPVVVKTGQMWRNAHALDVVPTTIVEEAAVLREVVAARRESIVVQDYLPAQGAEDWIVNAYVDARGDVLFCGTARKYRSWLPGTGVACLARAEPNPQVDRLSRRLLQGVGYRGLVDVDFRLDPRDGIYKLLDFNPRMGAASRVFRSSAGLDLVQIALLDLVGRSPGPQEQQYGVRLLVENLDAPARFAYRSHVPRRPGDAVRLSWWDPSDPLPFLAMVPWQVGQWSLQVEKRVRQRVRSNR